MRILTAEAMRDVDRRAIEELGVPSLVLMENAAIGAADALGERFPEARVVALFAGPGNNGGDALAVARHLSVRGYRVEVVLAAGSKGLSGDAAVQLEICRRMDVPIVEVVDEESAAAVFGSAGHWDVVVDGLFGTGLGRPLEGRFAALVEGINESWVPCVALDIPSGLSGSRRELLGPHVESELTVTFAALKMAHVFPPAAEAVGEVVVADLGIPRRLVEEAEGGLHLLVGEELSGWLIERGADGHKGDFGHVLVVGGSRGKAGAVVLAARGAVRGGAGLVTVGVAESLVDAVDTKSVESMTLGLAEGDGGALTSAAADSVLRESAERSVLAIGPGLGTLDETVALVRRVVLEAEVPVVLDADGLNAFAGVANELGRRSAATILTPHPGELGRLLGVPTAAVTADRLAAAQSAAELTGAVVLLKGHLTLVAEPGGEVHVNPSGNPGMASGGSGDVLTGLLAALVAQGYEPLAAACLGAYLHGRAGDLALTRSGPEGLTAGDLLRALPAAFAELRA